MMISGTNRLVVAGRCHLFVWLNCFALLYGIENSFAVYADDLSVNQSSQILTNINQFREEFNENADITHQFHLIGTVTMVDTNRNLFVLQDDVGAMAFSLNRGQISFQPGQLVSIEGDEASPYFESFPSYPYQPSGEDIRNSFEAPSNWGEYHLTRMRGYLHPPVTGDYTFWIASDNSSELWLSSDDKPAKAKKIAFIKSGDWVNQHEWLRYPSQRSETINLSADKTYYIEAVSEQLLLDEHLAVAWQPPGLRQSIIDGRYLAPWVEGKEQAQLSETHGALREYWTNYTLGNLVGIIGQKPFTSMFALKGARVTVMGRGIWPEPQQIFLNQPLLPENNFHWAKVQGTINFVGINGNSAVLELTYDGSQAQVRVADWKVNLPQHFQNRRVQVEGVCEGIQTDNGYLIPGSIWTPSNEHISFIESTNLNNYSDAINSLNHFTEGSMDTNRVWSGYVALRGVVTFNDQVLGKHFLFIQNDATGIYISEATHHFNQLQVGQWIEIGGAMKPDGYTPSLNPDVVMILGRRPMPQPITQPVEVPVPASRNGQWTELEGVIHSVNTNGTMAMMEKKGSIPVWIGRTAKDALNRYVDSVLRVRGVLSVATENDPILLVPSRSFVEMEDEVPEDPFGILSRYTTQVNDAAVDGKWIHRVKIEGVVNYRNGQSLFVQDAYGGVRVELPNNNSLVKVGDKLEVVGFPGNGNLPKVLTEALVRVVGSSKSLNSKKLSLTKTNLSDYYGTLVSLEAVILTQKIKGDYQVLDLQEGQHFYEAVLSSNFGWLPVFESGSCLRVTGVLDLAGSVSEKSTGESDLSESVKILLRDPQDVVLLRGAPWWTWKGFMLLASILLTVIITGLLVIYVLRRRLEHQRLAKFIFSRQILQSQEEERRRIAVNLHDTLGQNLLFIKNQSHLAMQLPVDESVIRHRLSEISEVTINAIEEVRQITRNLRPYQLDRLGLTHAIRAVIKQVSESSKILFASHVDEIDGTFDKESEIHVYRIIQESINNIIKHSGATEATIVIKKNTAIVSLSIRDNGQGFDVTLSRPVGFGLNNIIERAWILGGESKIDTSPGRGTNLIFEIPIPNSSNEA
jgi:signal transduction histidine kinase